MLEQVATLDASVACQRLLRLHNISPASPQRGPRLSYLSLERFRTSSKYQDRFAAAEHSLSEHNDRLVFAMKGVEQWTNQKTSIFPYILQ
jgi:hypothetical protein